MALFRFASSESSSVRRTCRIYCIRPAGTWINNTLDRYACQAQALFAYYPTTLPKLVMSGTEHAYIREGGGRAHGARRPYGRRGRLMSALSIREKALGTEHPETTDSARVTAGALEAPVRMPINAPVELFPIAGSKQ